MTKEKKISWNELICKFLGYDSIEQMQEAERKAEQAHKRRIAAKMREEKQYEKWLIENFW